MVSSAVELLLHRYRRAPRAARRGPRGGRTRVFDRLGVAGRGRRGHRRRSSLRRAAGRRGSRWYRARRSSSAHGRRRVTGVTVGPPGSTSGQKVACDLLVIACVQMPSTNLLGAGGGAARASTRRCRRSCPSSMPERTHAVGAVAGAGRREAAVAQGRLAGLEIAAALGTRGRRAPTMRGASSGSRVSGRPGRPASRGLGRLREAVRVPLHGRDLEGAEDGGDRGVRLDGAPQALHDDHDGSVPGEGVHVVLPAALRPGDGTIVRGDDADDRTTALGPRGDGHAGGHAAARRARRRTMHDRHAAAGAEFMWAGDWRRPHHYTTPEEEVDAVRNRVGLIDVSTLGKFRVKGPQSVELLERLYPNRFSDLAVGRVRYGAMLNDEGVILDDGAVVRRRGRRVLRHRDDRQHGGAGAVDHLVERRLAARRARAERHRRVRGRQPGGAASEERHGGAHRRRRVGRGDAVHVRRRGSTSRACRRSCCGSASWASWATRSISRRRTASTCGTRIMETGGSRRDRRVRSRGAADPPSREAAHPRRAGHRRRVRSVRGRARLDGEGGQAGLPRHACASGPEASRARTSAWSGSPRADGWLPPEGASVVRDGRWVGRVTSARRSAAVGSVIGLAWVPAGWASDEQHVRDPVRREPHDAGRSRTAPFYDPQGQRLRS